MLWALIGASMLYGRMLLALNGGESRQLCWRLERCGKRPCGGPLLISYRKVGAPKPLARIRTRPTGCPASHSGNKESKTDDGGRTVRLSSTLRHPLFAVVPQMASFNSLEARNATFLLALI